MPLEIEDLDAAVAGIGDEHLARRDRHTRGVAELAGTPALLAPIGDELVARLLGEGDEAEPGDGEKDAESQGRPREPA